ncbi:MAG: Smr/MutS family protein [Pseudomonadota bacterium]
MSSAEEAAWARLAESVTPLAGRAQPSFALRCDEDQPKPAKPSGTSPKAPALQPKPRRPVRPPTAAPAPPLAPDRPGLDSHWDRRIKGGRLEPDLTLDLHGHTLDSAYGRINHGLDQARAMGARVVLVIAGRERPVAPADRMGSRGAIRAKLLDWLAASPHADAIAAVRRAHRTHGGEGALYLVLKRHR